MHGPFHIGFFPHGLNMTGFRERLASRAFLFNKQDINRRIYENTNHLGQNTSQLEIGFMEDWTKIFQIYDKNTMDYNTKTKMSSLLLPSRSRCKQLEGFLTANRQSCTNTDLYLSKFVKEVILQICICNRILRSQLQTCYLSNVLHQHNFRNIEIYPGKST